MANSPLPAATESTDWRKQSASHAPCEMPSTKHQASPYLIISLCAPCCSRFQSLDFLKHQVDLPLSSIIIIGASGKDTAGKKKNEGITISLGLFYVPRYTNNKPFKKINCDFLGDPVVKDLPANAGDAGSIPGLGRFHMPQGNKAHAPQILRLTCLEPVLCNKWSLGTTTSE